MKIDELFSVKSINKSLVKEWCLKKHYAHRIPSISFAFGLFKNEIMVGFMTIGKPASNALCIGVCGIEYSKYVYELNRLCINDGLEKNTLSFFISKCFKLIDQNLIIVSYADTSQGHHGYIYQATNWIYTGKTKERTDIGFENGKHSRHYDKNLDKSNRKNRSSKHRYIYFLGKMKKEFKEKLNYMIEPYPKGENKRYDSSFKPKIQAEIC